MDKYTTTENKKLLLDKIRKEKQYVIYGAQVIAVGAKEAIKHLTGISPLCFVVGKSQGRCPSGNPSDIDGIEVLPIDIINKDTFIVVAVTELIQKEVLPFLREQGYQNVFPLTAHEEHMLMSEYYKSIGLFPLADCVESNSINRDFVIYEVMNDKDKPLDYHPELFSYEKSIQAGAALTDISLTEIKDNTEENISTKNRMYCEMSAVYWIWKNTNHDWVGIEHYRRHLLVKPTMLSEDIDAILPLPYICYPDEATQFLRFTTKDVLNTLLKALKDLHPDKYEEYYNIIFGKYQYTYNMICVRKKVFDDYCSWFFEITEYMETMADSVPEIKETRALSYVAEVLTNLYFMSNQKNLRIRHVEKEIYT